LGWYSACRVYITSRQRFPIRRRIRCWPQAGCSRRRLRNESKSRAAARSGVVNPALLNLAPTSRRESVGSVTARLASRTLAAAANLERRRPSNLAQRCRLLQAAGPRPSLAGLSSPLLRSRVVGRGLGADVVKLVVNPIAWITRRDDLFQAADPPFAFLRRHR